MNASPSLSAGPPVDGAQIQQAHRLYCQLTGQTLSLGFDRERLWYELLRAGHTPEEVRTVILYLQREIRAERRNVGALKLSNLLQPDRFEEDLQISRVRLRPPAPPPPPLPPAPPPLSPEEQERRRQRGLECLRELRARLSR
jgi:hypothetical protein